MGKRKFDPVKEIAEHCVTLRKTPAQWVEIRDHGCNDPSWADGCNMNLLCNHMVYAKREITRLCQEYGILEPPELEIPIPPYVDENFFSDPNCDRAKRVLAFGRCYNRQPPCSWEEMKAYQDVSKKQSEPAYKQLQLFG